MSELSQLVATTYGPRGSKVVVRKDTSLLMTTDGSALARELRFQGRERLGVSLVRAATSVVDGTAGDGTSTTTLLANAVVQAALDHYNPRTWNPVPLVRDLRACLPVAEDFVKDLGRVPDEARLRRVAFMASHGEDLIADSVVDAVTRVGETGTVLVQAGDGVGIELDHREGLVLSVGWASHGMGADGPREMEGPMVAVVNQPLSTFEDVQSLMEESSQWPGRGLVLFCPKLEGDALTTLLLNDRKGVLPCIAVTYHHPSPDVVFDWLEDVATVTNARTVGVGRGDDLRAFQTDWLGSARKITVGKSKTEILSYPDADDRIGERVTELLRRAEGTHSDYDRDRYRERAGAIDGGLCVLKVGGYTTVEAQDRRSRTEDTLHAVRVALTTAVVPGAGRAFHWVSARPELHTTLGGRVLARALEEPLRVLCARSGATFDTMPAPDCDIWDAWTGWCPVRGTVVDFWDDPAVVDPTGVVVGALRAAVSVACEVLLTGVVLAKT